MSAQRAPLPGRRWHFTQGPIDLVIGADGEELAVRAAHEAAWQRFGGVLQELVVELSRLRQRVSDEECSLQGPIARRMWRACAPFRPGFITPMAAVAGAVAEEIVEVYARSGVSRAWVNNGGDIALHLTPGASVRIGLFADLARVGHSTGIDGNFIIASDLPVRGVATSGWRGRSFSLGIADSVTVLAATAAEADAAATVIANAVNVDDPGIHRLPANECKDDSDLGDLLVTRDVGTLAPAQVRSALDAGVACAEALQRMGLVWSVVLVCQGQWRIVQPLSSRETTLSPPTTPTGVGGAVGSVFA